MARESGLAWVEAASIGSRRRAVYGAAGEPVAPTAKVVAIGARCLSGGKAPRYSDSGLTSQTGALIWLSQPGSFGPGTFSRPDGTGSPTRRLGLKPGGAPSNGHSALRLALRFSAKIADAAARQKNGEYRAADIGMFVGGFCRSLGWSGSPRGRAGFLRGQRRGLSWNARNPK